MLFTIERYAIRAGTRFLRRCYSRSVDIQASDTQEFMLQSSDNFTSIRREGEKCLRIAILGAPNAGKSTLINQLIRRSVCPTSSKVHTTLTKMDAVYSEGDTQLIFIDTPGVVATNEFKRYKLDNSFKNDPKVSLTAAGIIGIVQDAHNIFTRDKINILELLESAKDSIPLILIFNKVDKLKKKHILLHLVNVLDKSKNSLNFSDIFMISALTGDDIDDLRTYLLDSAKPQDWHYKRYVYSDHTCEDIIQQTVRAKLLEVLPNEMPYNLQVKLEHFDIGLDDNIDALVSITCSKKRIHDFLLRSKAYRIKNIAIIAERELRHAFRILVRLKLSVQHNEPK